MSEVKQVATWLSFRNYGVSSMVMLCKSQGENYGDASHPSDPADFNRCLELVKHCPFVREAFEDIKKISREWKTTIDNWHKIEISFIQEAGSNWHKSRSAPKTYELMKKLGL